MERFMKNENRLLRICTILIALTIICCVGFSYLTRLKEPVFLTNCIAVSAVPSQSTGYQQPVLELQYLANNYDSKEVTMISFLEAPDYSFTATENAQYYNNSFTFFHGNTDSQRGEAIGRYSLRTVYLYMNNYFIGEWNGEVELNHALINFSDGSTTQVDLGRILIYSDALGVPALDMTSSGSSSQGVAKTTLFVREKLSNLKVESPIVAEADPVMELTINSYAYDELEALELKRGDTISIENIIKNDTGEGDFDVYDVRPKLTYTREDGTQGFTRIYDMTHRKYLYGYMDVLKYLMERGAF
jgi:hypothetical protein